MNSAMRMLETACRTPALLLGVFTLATVLAYAPGLRGPFIFDDAIHIVANPALMPDAADLQGALASNRTDFSGRPLAMLSFALNAYLAGGPARALPFKITNIAIHLLNAALVYWLCALLLRQLGETPAGTWSSRRWVAALVAGIWALHPLQLTSVLYVVQRMNSLATLFVLGGLIAFCYGRSAVQVGQPKGYLLMGGGLIGGVALGVACKESAALLPLYAFVIECTLFRVQPPAAIERRRLGLFYGTFVALPALLALLWLAVYSDIVPRSYSMREFDLYERLLTEARVLWFYVSLLLVPIPQRLSLFHDDLPISTGLTDPWTTLPAILGLVTVTVVALVARRRQPLLSFAVLWFLVGHTMESSFLGLEIAHEHRNYLPSLGVVVGCVYALLRGMERLRISPHVQIGLALLLPVTLAVGTHMRAQTWSSQDGIVSHMVRHHPSSPRAHASLAQLYAERHNALGALQHYRRAADLAPSETSYLLRLALTAARSELTGMDREHRASETLAGTLGIPRGIDIDNAVIGRARLRLATDTKREIEQALKHNPVHARTAQALTELATCVPIDPDGCGYLYADVVQWHALAVRNPWTLSPIRNDLLIGLARLCLQHGEYACALETAGHARAVAPQNPNFILMQADIYYRLDRLEESKRVLLALEDLPAPLAPALQKQANSLAALIRTRRGAIAK